MKRDDVQLIHSILSGNDEAFSTLVKKYQKSVHALAWRKIGDFHHAEEITQDTFLQAYKKLSTLKDPNQFAGWLYVIANRLCLNWMRKKKPMMQSLEGTRVGEVEKSSYTRYVLEQRETAAAEHRGEIVEKLLARLPESERTVVTLYYLAEMTSKEIGKFLGVSVKTVHSRLHRARKRLEEKDELLISEVLGGVQLPANLIENIMQQVADMKPTSPPVAKPLLPWMAFGMATVLVLLLFGVSNQYLIRYQKPYSFEAQSEVFIEIVDAPVLLNVDSKPTVRNQIGRTATTDKSNGIGTQIDASILSSNTRENSSKFSASQWTQTRGPHEGAVSDIFVTSEGVCYATAPTGIYQLTVDAPIWTRLNTNIPIGQFRMPMAENDDTLYIVSADKIFASIDKGETWHVFCSRPEGYAVGLIITNEAHKHNSHPRPVMYLALQTKGVFRSTDAGAQWHLLENGLTDKSVHAVAAVENTVFAGTDSGLYRLNSDIWERLPVHPPQHAILSLTVFENNLYVGTGTKPSKLEFLESSETSAFQVNIMGSPSSERVFHSTDFGASWTEIMPENEFPFRDISRRIVFLMNTGEMLLPQGIVAMDKNTFYRASSFGIHRTTNGGKSWHPFTEGIMGTAIQDLVAVNNRFYAHTSMGLVQSVDGGETWEPIAIDSSKHTLEESKEDFSPLHFPLASRLAIAGEVLYGIVPEKDNLRIFQLSADDNALVPIQEIPAFKQASSPVDLKAPTFEPGASFAALWTEEVKHKHEHLLDPREIVDDLPTILHFFTNYNGIGGFAISGQTFYTEWERRLFKWQPGDSEWTDTGLIDTSESLNFDRRFKLAISGETVYVGKRDGRLFQSLDGGNNWRDITPNLPLRFTHFKDIVFAGSRVCVATDVGVLVSQGGEHWRVLTDEMGVRIVIDGFAVNHTSVYGAGDTGVYHLDVRGKWEQVSPRVPGKIISLVAVNDRLYIATQRRGVFHIPIEERG